MLLPIVELKSGTKQTDKKSDQPSGLDLTELLAKQKTLKPVERDALPEYLGGSHGSHRHDDSDLKKELLVRAGDFHAQLRPRMEAFQGIRQRPKQRGLHDELAIFLAKKGSLTKSPLRPLYELDRIVAGKPGWLELQAEIRAYNRSGLIRVVFEDFYIIRSAYLPV